MEKESSNNVWGDGNNMVKMKEKLSSGRIIISLLFFDILWAVVSDAWGYSSILFKFENGKYIYGYLSRLIWVLPAVFLISFYNEKLKINYSEMISFHKLDKSIINALLFCGVLVITSMFINHGGIWINEDINQTLEFVKLMIVGFVEECVYRGWGFNALMNTLNDKKAAILSTLMFILLHWPAYFIKYFRHDFFDLSGLITQSISALVFGLIFCWLMKKGKSLWGPIIVHTLYDYCIILFVG